MANKVLRVNMLGAFSIRWGDREINDGDNRSRKVWLLLAYMIYYRDRPITNEDLAALFWSEEDDSVNPLNALKTMFHRVRASLNQLSDDAGRQLILRRKDSYAWNTDLSLTLDVEKFESLCKKGAALTDDQERLKCWLPALALYQGDFLTKLSAEPWVVPISAYYHQLYIQTALETIAILDHQGRTDEAADLCRQAIKQEPFNEELYRCLMRLLLEMEDQKGVVTVYEEMSELLFSTFGVMPSEESMALYRKALRTVNQRAVSMDLVMEQLREELSDNGALMCEYDFFKIIYQAMARAVERSGDAVHLALISVIAKKGGELSRRSLDLVMENLGQVVRMNLRRGDVATRCSISQFLLMLPQANYEDSCMVSRRLTRTFARQYPHSPAAIKINVHPLEPVK